jgi:hypothetical protein
MELNGLRLLLGIKEGYLAPFQLAMLVLFPFSPGNGSKRGIHTGVHWSRSDIIDTDKPGLEFFADSSGYRSLMPILVVFA